MVIRNITHFVFFLFASFLLTGQDVQPCAADKILKSNLEAHPHLKERRAALQKYQDQATGFVQSRSVSIIPVVVHIVYNTDKQNISDQQVFSQIATINRDFRLKNSNLSLANANFRSLAADVTMEFCLVNKDPFGNATNGITRNFTPENQIGRKTAVSDNRRAIYYTDLTGVDAWDTKKYLNIWVCELGNGLLGYASFPEGALPEEDGIVIDFRSFGTNGTAKHPTNLGKTLSHEIGHYFNLKHVWGNSIGNCSVDDDLQDTPPQERPTGGCPSSSQVSCNSFDMYNNYMDYANDECLSIFTPDQVDRMLNTLFGVRSALLDSEQCSFQFVADPLSEIEVWNNPSSGEINLFLDKGALFEVTISGYSIVGQLILTEKKYFFPAKEVINLGYLPQGLYLIKLATADGQIIKKIIIN